MKEISITEYLAYTDEELFNQLGKMIFESEEQIGAFPPSLKELYNIGVKWFTENTQAIKNKVCNNNKVQFYVKKSEIIDNIHLGLLIIDSIKETFGVLHTPLISAIIVRRGVIMFCSWPNKES